MGLFLYILIGILCLGFLIWVIWRFLFRYFALPCPTWFYWLVEIDNPFAKANRTSIIINQLNLKPGVRVLDAGCGPGRLTIPIAKKIESQGKIVAMDLQSGMLQRVQKKAEDANLHNIEFLRAGLGDGKLENARYDRVVLASVLGEIPNRKKALKEIFDALKPEGILTITETIFDPHFQDRETVSSLAKSIGFQERNIIGNRLAFTMQFTKPL